MDVAEVVDIALAGLDERRVEVTSLEPARVGAEAVGGLAQLITELVGNALAFSAPDDLATVTGVFDGGDYLISISDRGVGIPEHLLEGLNQMLAQRAEHAGSEPRLGIALVAMLAARLGMSVRLVPGAPGTTARVTVPARLASAATEKPIVEGRLPPRLQTGMTVDLTAIEPVRSRSTGVVAMSEEAREEAEAFLERVFSSLTKQPAGSERPAMRSNSSGNGREERRPTTRRTVRGDNALRTRVPGTNFSPVDDDPSTVAAERAIDIRTALSRYSEGRRSAEQADEV